jgi:hypothetical protein
MADDLLETLKRLHAGATPGPWRVSRYMANYVDTAGEREQSVCKCHQDSPKKGDPAPDAALIATLRNALPEIIQALEENERMKRTLDFAREVFGPND